jgi:hypothetical protein
VLKKNGVSVIILTAVFCFLFPVSGQSAEVRPAEEILCSYVEDFRSDPAAVRPQAASNLDIRLVTDEADAVMAILQKTKAAEPPAEADWERLFSTKGYIRLKKREAELKRSFEDQDFKGFVLSSELLARTAALAETLDRWKQADLRAAASRALAYLPAGTAIRAKVYPVIKPKTNSFVFELQTDPAIFLYLNPDMNSSQFENTVAHELHHIGLAAVCLPVYEGEEFKKKPAEVRAVLEWAGAFGEGIAMLAAAGGPDVHPHATSPVPDRERWDKDMASFDADLKKVNTFFLDVLDGRLKGEEAIREGGFSFFGIQGPWYTVGWKMAVLIEKTFGRAKLIDCLCDSAGFLASYNEAAAKRNARSRESLALWPSDLLKRIGSL